ncbi:uncharacterized protein PAF06_012481 [Gastrophryne carolinensis]
MNCAYSLVPLNLKEKILHEELFQLLDCDESDSAVFQAKDGTLSTVKSTSMQTDVFCSNGDFLSKDETIPCYMEEFEKDAQDDIIVLGSLSQEQNIKYQEGFLQSGRKLLYRRSNDSFKKTESQLFNAANAHKEEILAKLGNLSEVNNQIKSNETAGLCWKSQWSDRPQPIQIFLKTLRGAKDKIPRGQYVVKTSLLSRPGGNALQWSKIKNHLWAETTLPVYHKGNFFDVEMTVDHTVNTLLPTEKKIKSGMTLLLELYLLHGTDTYIDRAVGWGIFPLCDNNFNVLEGKYRCPILRGHYDSRIDRFSKIEDLIMADLDHWLCNLYFQIVKLPLDTNKQKECDFFVQLPQEFLTYTSHNEKKPINEKELQKPIRKSCHYQEAQSSMLFTYSQGQPLASQKEPNVSKELIQGTEKDKKTHLNEREGKERKTTNKAQAKLQQTSLTQVVQVEEISEESTIRHLKRKMFTKGIARNKIAPYTDKQSDVITSKGNFDFDKKVTMRMSVKQNMHNNAFHTVQQNISNMHFPAVGIAGFKGSFDVPDKSKQLTFCGISNTPKPFIAGNTPFLELRNTSAKLIKVHTFLTGFEIMLRWYRSTVNLSKVGGTSSYKYWRFDFGHEYNEEHSQEETKMREQHFKWAQKAEPITEKHIEKCSTATSYLDELEKHQYSVCTKPLEGIKIYQKIVKHTNFVIWAVFSELDMGQWRSQDFWLIMLMMALMWFMRLYLHYCSQWLFLQSISIPILKFAFYPHTVELTYQHSLMHTREELFMVVVGPMSLNISMFLMILLRWSCQILFHSFPTILSKFIIALGLWTVLDPLAILIVDALLGRLSYSAEEPIADAAKLYWYFFRVEQSGIPGVIITVLIYTMICIISSSVLYLYFLRVHKESWILDVFQRISSAEGHFPIPYDLEVSNQELSQIVKKAEQWRGINGERRKVAVYDYIWNKETTSKISVSNVEVQNLEHQDSINDGDGSKDITTHILIYTIHLKGFCDLYRQFLRLPDGAIVEIFGDLNDMSLLPNEVNHITEEQINKSDSACQAATTTGLRERKNKWNNQDSNVQNNWLHSDEIYIEINHQQERQLQVSV